MKKILYIITVLFCGLFLVGKVNAQIEVTGLKEAVEEEINYFGNKSNFDNEQTFEAYQEYVNKMKNADLSNYSEDDNKVNVYIFRGYSCWHCLDEVSWLSTQVKDYGKYFNVRSYEVWKNKDNNKLMNTVSKYLGQNASGVPFTVIGDKSYSGFSEATGNEMLKVIQEEFEKKDRYDIKNEINLEDGTVKNANKKSSNSVLIVLISLVLICGIAFIVYLSKSK